MSVLLILVAANIVVAVEKPTVASMTILAPDDYIHKGSMVEENPQVNNVDGSSPVDLGASGVFDSAGVNSITNIIDDQADDDVPSAVTAKVGVDVGDTIIKQTQALKINGNVLDKETASTQASMAKTEINQDIVDGNIKNIRQDLNDITTLQGNNNQQLTAMLDQMSIHKADEEKVDTIARGASDTDAEQTAMMGEILDSIKVLEARLKSAVDKVGDKVVTATNRMDQLFSWSYVATECMNANTNSLHEVVHDITSLDNKQFRTGEALIELMETLSNHEIEVEKAQREADLAAELAALTETAKQAKQAAPDGELFHDGPAP